MLYALKKVSLELSKCLQVRLQGLSERDKLNALNEVRLLASIQHPNIVSYKEAFIDKDTLCLVMEYVEEGDLLAKI